MIVCDHCRDCEATAFDVAIATIKCQAKPDGKGGKVKKAERVMMSFPIQLCEKCITEMHLGLSRFTIEFKKAGGEK